jgi:rsbT co-antagonist protein RsbR
MSAVETTAIAKLVADQEQGILSEWLDLQGKAGVLQTGRMSESELKAQCRDFLRLFREALPNGSVDVASAAYAPVRDFLADVSRSRAVQGFSPRETATFVFSLKQPLFNAMNSDKSMSPTALAQTIWALTLLLDELGLHTFEIFQKSREEVILRQQREIAELSTPVVKLWDGVLALPVIGTLDSQRTQVLMENLLQHIVDEGAEIAIIDITGVATVDTLTAQHLLKTVAAARLMGADCMISGIRPQIAQTIVHLGVELNVVSKATLADAFAIALRRIGRKVVKIRDGEAEKRKNSPDQRDA